MTKPICLLSCVSLLLSTHAWGGPTDSGPAMQVEVLVEQTELLLQPGKEIPVTIRVLDAAGQGVEQLAIQLDASRGSLQPATEQGKGIYLSRFRMPPERHPQAIILAAKVSGSAPGWTTLKLRSQVELPTTTSKPRVQVRLNLGGRTYGPIRSDARGRVKIPVEVGPGENEAQAVAVDEFGNRSERTVQIPIPPAPHLVGFAERDQLAADGRDHSEIYLVAVEPDGSPSESLKVLAIRKGGKLSASRRIAPGLFHLTYTAPQRLDRERIVLVLADKADSKQSRRKFVFRLTAGQPARLVLTAEPRSMPADGKSALRLTVAIADQAGNPLAGLAPTLRCPAGSLQPIQDLGGGRYQAELRAPAGKPGLLTCQAELALPGSKTLTAEAQISLSPPMVGALGLTASADRLKMDGRSTARIDVKVTDSSGNALDGVELRVEAGLGAIDQVSPDGGGRYHFSYTAPQGTESTRVQVVVIAGATDTALRKHLIIELEGVAPIRPPAPWVTLGPAVALLSNFGRLLSGGFSIDAAVRVPGLGGYLYLALEGGYRYGRSTDPTGLAGQQLRTDLEVTPLHLNLLLKLMPDAVATPILGIGGGLDFVQWAIHEPGGRVERDHSMLWGALALVGGEVKLGPGALVLSVRYLYAFLDDRAAIRQPVGGGGSRIKGSVGGLDVCLGYQLHF